MTVADKLKNEIANKQNNNEVNTEQQYSGLKGLLVQASVKKRFDDVLGKRASQFSSSLLNLYNGDPAIQEAEPMSIMASAMIAATLDLPIDKNLGFAWIVPFWDKKKGCKSAQFQLGYKGYIQLAQRTGQYKSINAIAVYEGELISWNALTEEIEFNPDGRTSDKVVGYCGYFKLINGFEKKVFWNAEQIENHRVKHNKAKDKKALNGVWRSDYDAMAIKTVIRNLLGKWGILSVEMQTALTNDESENVVTDENGKNVFDAPDEKKINAPLEEGAE
ncbi:recombinase RecT [Brochothrix thermosphacta]|uniref:recombinase RecT n=1 Tax=Brochothrix thermosphacta TaxID=2756 RepID=UPI0039B08E25